jgi:virulence factor
VEFTKRLHGEGVPAEQRVEGARVVAAWPGTSEIAPERLPGYVQTLRGWGVAIVERPEELRGHGVDAVLLEAQQGSRHAALALPWLDAGVPLFVDKPFACGVADAAAMVGAAARSGAPLLSASSLRFAEEVLGLAVGRVLGAHTYTPASLHPGNPGLFHYGVHGVEMLYALMGGPGCRRVRCASTEGADDVLGEWAGSRLGGVRGLRGGATGFGFIAQGEEAVVATRVDASFIYRNLLRVIVRVLGGGPSPVSAEELVEAVAFQECATASARADGAWVYLPTV